MAIETVASAENPVADRALRGPLAFAIGCFLIWGLAYGLLDVLNKHFQETLHVGKAQGIKEVARISHPAQPHQPAIARSLVAGGRLFTVSNLGIAAAKLDTLAPLGFLAFPAR